MLKIEWLKQNVFTTGSWFSSLSWLFRRKSHECWSLCCTVVFGALVEERGEWVTSLLILVIKNHLVFTVWLLRGHQLKVQVGWKQKMCYFLSPDLCGCSINISVQKKYVSTDGVFQAHRFHLELNWIEKNTSLIKIWAPQSAAIEKRKKLLCERLLGTWSQDEPSVHSGKYSNTLTFWADSLCSSRMQLNEWPQLYTAHSQYPPEQLQHCLVATWLVPPETAAASVQVLCTPNKQCTSLQCLFIQSHICSVHVCLASCNLPPALLAKLTWASSEFEMRRVILNLKVAYTVYGTALACLWWVVYVVFCCWHVLFCIIIVLGYFFTWICCMWFSWVFLGCGYSDHFLLLTFFWWQTVVHVILT